eukprot:7123096-Pyramimonas_sp.AAC.1
MEGVCFALRYLWLLRCVYSIRSCRYGASQQIVLRGLAHCSDALSYSRDIYISVKGVNALKLRAKEDAFTLRRDERMRAPPTPRIE